MVVTWKGDSIFRKTSNPATVAPLFSTIPEMENENPAEVKNLSHLQTEL